MADLPGKDTSLWIDTTEETQYPELKEGERPFDILIIGGGMSGILTAWMLEQEGFTTAIIEKERIIQNTTGNTTAKLTSQHNLIYDDLINKHGLETARAYGKANQQAIEDIEALVRSLEIECDFSRREAYVFTEKADNVKAVKEEVVAAKKIGLPASYESSCDLPFDIKAAIRFSDQAQFHPRKFLLAIAKKYVSEGGQIFELTEAKDIKPGRPVTLKTNKAELRANYVVSASKYAFWRSEIIEKNSWNKLSYALGVKLADDTAYPNDMYISAGRPVRTIRSHPYEDGEILIFGGESHELTKDYDKNEHYKKLIDDVKKHFDVDKIVYRWIAGDVMPNDRLPIIGTYPEEENIFIITGFQAWGLCWAMVAAEMITDAIADRPHPLRKVLSPARFE